MAGFGGTALCGDGVRSQPLAAQIRVHFRADRRLHPSPGAANPMAMELDLDESSLAIGRIERALSRIEKALADRANRPASAVAAPAADQSALKAEVAAVIGELDRLIAEADRG